MNLKLAAFVSDTMTVRQNTVRKSAFLPGGAASCRAALGLLGCFRFWEYWSLGGRMGGRNKPQRNAKKCATRAKCCTMVSCCKSYL